jgi:hypothetical protein
MEIVKIGHSFTGVKQQRGHAKLLDGRNVPVAAPVTVSGSASCASRSFAAPRRAASDGAGFAALVTWVERNETREQH